MAKQLNLLSTGQVVPTALHIEMQQSYLEYAMSVIVGRALPDVRDGLKPVHRRILYAMHELGLTPDGAYRKCARVVGDVLGKYHPHGDQAVYDALVRMVQKFSTRYPLLDGHGNFGSVDNDPPAAMRYTETRLAPISFEAMLAEMESATVDFIGNFDNSQQEPVVLPAQLPILLLNGCSGIAVGMATNIPPHNLGEIVDGLIALIDKPDLTDQQLFNLIPGPDFPTGGEIVDLEGIKSAYTTGKGSIVVRGISKIEEIQAKGRHRRNAIVITELPFQVNKAGWIEKVAELVNQGKIEGISDIRDESDREGMRVVIELKREIDPQGILQHLYHQTALQTTFGAILLALVDQQPRQLTLRELLQHFLNFRIETLTRRYTHELQKTQERLHIVEGLLEALTNLDQVIEILRSSADGTTAKQTFIRRLKLSERQADAILAMPMRRLTGLEKQNLQAEFDQLRERRQQLQMLLDDRQELLKALKKDLRTLKRKYGDERRTRLTKNSSKLLNPATVKPSNVKTEEPRERKTTEIVPTAQPAVEEEVILEVSARGYVRRLPVESGTNGKKKTKKSESATPNEDVVLSVPAKTTHDLIVLMRTGKVYAVKVGEIPDSSTSKQRKGTPLLTLLPNSAQSDPDNLITQFVVGDYLEHQTLVMVTAQGRIKRISLLELQGISARGLTVMKLKEDDSLMFAQLVSHGQDVVLATSGGRLLRFPINEEQLPVMGKTAQGLLGLRITKQEHLVGFAVVKTNDKLCLVTELGYAKSLPVTEARSTNRANVGMNAIRFASKTDHLVGMIAAGGEFLLVTSTDRLLRIEKERIPVVDKDGVGVRLKELNPGEKVVTVRTVSVV